ncbi:MULTISPECIES: YjiH family protein [Oceanobacillus]|uniref:Nucleoside recognition n=2 Tax=Oceanobacillus TaxID=182709 RepID=A0A0A1M6V7_9BACI|nr:YjiH family protein [Oceanobacillus oncorhynchi]MDM8102364.1 YjiH family protein [Oceanobacillus oncorhynchi]UUI39336.1 YjiH family protein [Oceanobacillus oncorhynchi]CEI81035.1 Nucleoside recognition [Oceanobacillus oncorhynchi]
MSEIQTTKYDVDNDHKNNRKNIVKFSIYSLIGGFMFFIPITINGNASIMLDHMVTFIRNTFPAFVPYYLLIVIALGAVYPFIRGTWNKGNVNTVLSFFKLLGLVAALMIVFNIGPAWLFNPDMGPFIFNSLVTPVGILVPIGAVFLALIVSYGLLEFIGVLMQRIMRPVWKTPGRSAIDAVASFVGSYSIGLLITNRVFKEGKYSVKEASIIATGFSTVSVTFMVVVANTLDLMGIWNLYFWSTLVITFLVTAITVRLWPLNKMSNEYYDGAKPQYEEIITENRIKVAWEQAMKVADNAPSLFENIKMNLKDGMVMTMAILPSIMSIGLLGLVLAEYTPIFDIVGYIFYPFTWLVQLPEPLLAAKAVSMGIVEMFLPALMVTEAVLITKYVIAVVCISSIIFFSAVVPVILSTDIPISIPKLIVIWFERVVLTILIAAPVGYLLL